MLLGDRRRKRQRKGCARIYLGVRASGGKGGAESGGEEEELLQLGIRRPDAEHLHFFPAAEERRGRDLLGVEQAAVRALVEE